MRAVKAEGGASLGKILKADLQIVKNDDPIFFSGKDTMKDGFLWEERYILDVSLCISAEPVVVSLPEGAVANFTVLRTGRADFVATVMYRVEYGEASPADFTVLNNGSLLVFDVGERMKNISVALEDDNIPETDEPFSIVLHNATGERRLTLKAAAARHNADNGNLCAGDAVVYGAVTATVVIEANDDANGIFSLEPAEKDVEEGNINDFK